MADVIEFPNRRTASEAKRRQAAIACARENLPDDCRGGHRAGIQGMLRRRVYGAIFRHAHLGRLSPSHRRGFPDRAPAPASHESAPR